MTVLESESADSRAEVLSIHVSPDGGWVATGDSSGSPLRLTSASVDVDVEVHSPDISAFGNFASGTLSQESGSLTNARDVKFGKRNGFLAVASGNGDDGRLAIFPYEWHIANPSSPIVVKDVLLGVTSSAPQELAWHPNGTHLAAATVDGQLRVFNLSMLSYGLSDGTYVPTGEAPQTASGSLGVSVSSIAWSPQGTHIAAAAGGNVFVMEADYLRKVAQVTADDGRTYNKIRFNRDGGLLAAGYSSQDGSGGFLLVREPSEARDTIDTSFPLPVKHLHFSNDSTKLAVSGDGDEVKVYRLNRACVEDDPRACLATNTTLINEILDHLVANATFEGHRQLVMEHRETIYNAVVHGFIPSPDHPIVKARHERATEVSLLALPRPVAGNSSALLQLGRNCILSLSSRVGSLLTFSVYSNPYTIPEVGL